MLMKTFGLNKMLPLLFLMSGGIAVYGQGNQEELPGDNFSLEGALELFKKSASPEEFERLLNSSDARVNNLDLNGDGAIDYIRVIDQNEGNVHVFILQAIVSERESQDIAVIELEKLANGKAVLQITGDEDIYGIETIIEPTNEVRVNAGTTTTRVNVNVWAWPSVQYIYSPYYSSVWVSPWGWSMQPVWWRPWSPVAYHVYDPWWSSYRPYYSTCYTHRVVYAQHIYRPYRTTSVVVLGRHHSQIEHYRSSRNDHGRNGRDRYDGGRSSSNGRQNSNGYVPDTNGRQRSTSSYTANSRSSTNHVSQRTSDVNRRSSTIRDGSSDSNRPASEYRSGTPQRKANVQQRQDVSQNRSNTGFSNRTTSRQQVTRSSDQRSQQRSPSVQMSRPKSSGSPNIQRSGNRGGGSKSSEQKRGRH